MKINLSTNLIKKHSYYVGYSLIEVMISLVLGVLVITGVFQIYISNKQSYRLVEGQSRLQENARFALNFLSDDIRMAGYTGCVSRGITPDNVLNTPTNYLYNIANPIQGFEWDNGTAAWLPAVDASIINPLPGSDIITVRRAETAGLMVVTHANGTDDVTLASAGTPVLENCDLAIISNCSAATLFQISTFPDPANPPFIATHTGGVCVPIANPGSPPAAPGNSTTSLSRSYAGGQLYRYQNISYFIRNFVDPAGNQIPTLYRLINSQNATALVEGIERMQVFYGADTDNDGNADRFFTANNVPAWNQVVSVRISLLVSSIQANLITPPPAGTVPNFNTAPINLPDRRLRRQFTTTIAIRNTLR